MRTKFEISVTLSDEVCLNTHRGLFYTSHRFAGSTVMKTTCPLRYIVALLFLAAVAPSTRAGLFSLDIVEPATHPGDEGLLRIMYEDADDNYSFFNGGLHLKLTSSAPGVINFKDATILNDDHRWTFALADQISDNEIGRLFAASILTNGLAGSGRRTFAEVKYSLAGTGSTNLMVDIGGEDPVVEGSLGDISHRIGSRGLCVGECTLSTPPMEINLGESWTRLREQMYPPLPQPPGPVVPSPVEQVSVEQIPVEPESIIPPVIEIDEPVENQPEVVEPNLVDLINEITVQPYPHPRIVDLVEWQLNWINGENIDLAMGTPIWRVIDGVSLPVTIDLTTLSSPEVMTDSFLLYSAAMFGPVAFDGDGSSIANRLELRTVLTQAAVLDQVAVPEPNALALGGLVLLTSLSALRRSVY